MALINSPDLVICDEPTTALDVTVQARVLRLLDEVLTAEGAACLFISHDLAVVSQVPTCWSCSRAASSKPARWPGCSVHPSTPTPAGWLPRLASTRCRQGRLPVEDFYPREGAR